MKMQWVQVLGLIEFVSELRSLSMWGMVIE